MEYACQRGKLQRKAVIRETSCLCGGLGCPPAMAESPPWGCVGGKGESL